MFGGWFRSLFREWMRPRWYTSAAVDSLIASPDPGDASSPGEKTSADHMLARLIRTSHVMVGGKALPPHDMPMAKYVTSRMRRSLRLRVVPGLFNHNS